MPRASRVPPSRSDSAAPKVSLKDIAAAAGVSTMAVSFALRNSNQVSAETRKKVVRIAQKLGYRPDPAVARYMDYLRRGRPSGVFHSTIGFLNFQDNPGAFHGGGFFTPFLRGVRERAEATGYAVEEFWAGDPAIKPGRLKGILQARGIDSIIIPPLPGDSVHLGLDCSGFFGVTIAFTLEEPRLPRVSHDHAEGVRLALDQAAALGYRRPGFVCTAHSDSRVRHHWAGGFVGRDLHLSPDDQIPPLVLPRLDAPALDAWLKKHRPDVVLSPQAELHPLLLARGHRIPRDIGFIILDHSAGKPTWAGINQQVSYLGRTAVDVLIAQRNRNEPGEPEHARTILIGGSWQPGATVRRVRA